ncbi:MAG TPA: putative porin, partial [Pyrinomonadaceae bacterium]
MKLSPSPSQTCSALRLSLCLAVTLFAFTFAHAQELVKTATKPVDQPEETNVSERVRLLEAELERQNAKLDQLQKTITEQQSAFQALLDKLSVKSPSTGVTPETAAAPASASTQPEKPPIEQRVAKLENEALRIGPLKVSGDFRLRFDSIFRSATEPPDPPLQHVQNVRARYRLRLNLDTDIHPNLSFHAQLSTGPFNNPLTTDQDFTAVTARAPISISEAWVEYRPVKAVTLQGGR